MSYYDDERLAYPEAERVVGEYIRQSTRSRVTSVRVLKWADVENSHHNRRRVHDVLRRVAAETETEADWAGRTVFELPDDIDQ